MEAGSAQTTQAQRPTHRRNQPSKSSILRSLVSSKPQGSKSTEHDQVSNVASSRNMLYGKPQTTARSPQPAQTRSKSFAAISNNNLGAHRSQPSKIHGSDIVKSRGATNIGAIFSKANRSSKDVSRSPEGDKENTSPSASLHDKVETPIWAQFATTAHLNPQTTSQETERRADIENVIARYTPQHYSPSKQRNFNNVMGDQQITPTLSRGQRGSGVGGKSFEILARRFSGDHKNVARQESDARRSGDRKRSTIEEKVEVESKIRTVSGRSVDAPTKEIRTAAKRGGKVLAAVAALQGKSKSETAKQEPVLDPETVNQAFEAVLDSRNVPEPMRQKMRSLTLTVKADFIKQDQAGTTPPGSAKLSPASFEVERGRRMNNDSRTNECNEDMKSTKRSRTRSRTFTFSRGDKRTTEASPSKKQRARSKSRGQSAHRSQDLGQDSRPASSLSVRGTSRGRASTTPNDFISYLQQNQNPCVVEVGRVHKLRILLRNETVAWVDAFVSLGGMNEVVGLLHRIMEVEWREEHEDQLLHETLLCLKALCTTARAMDALESVADKLFSALVSMLYDDEKKGPAEYSTRSIILTLLFNFLHSSMKSGLEQLEQRAYRILDYMGEPIKSSDTQPLDFVQDMHVSRPYKLWCREITHVTKEVFWIFLHRSNIISLPTCDGDGTHSAVQYAELIEREGTGEAGYADRRFPGMRPPVPAAPYIGGVEWDATTYIASHLDLANGLLASLRTTNARNSLRTAMRDSGFERILGASLRTCKEKFYASVHDGLRVWVAAAVEDGWDTQLVCEGPTPEEQAARARSASPKKRSAADKPPQLDVPKIEAPKLNLGIDRVNERNGVRDRDSDEDDGWLG